MSFLIFKNVLNSLFIFCNGDSVVSVATKLEAQMFLLFEVTTLALEFSSCLLLNGYRGPFSRG